MWQYRKMPTCQRYPSVLSPPHPLSENYKTPLSRPLFLPFLLLLPILTLSLFLPLLAKPLGFQIPTMPDLGNLSLPSTLTLAPCSIVKPADDAAADDSAVATTDKAQPNGFGSDDGNEARVLKRSRGSLDRVKKTSNDKGLWDRLSDPYSLPFLVGAPKMVLVVFHFVCGFFSFPIYCCMNWSVFFFVCTWMEWSFESSSQNHCSINTLMGFVFNLINFTFLLWYVWVQVECSFCHHSVNPKEELLCSVRGCGAPYHKECAKEATGVSNLKKFKCPQHVNI